jgi:fido (protein-threonine AMPylation protein)
MSAGPEKRDSRALEPELITDPTAKAEAETRNGFRQYDLGIRAIQMALDRGAFKLRPSLVLALHREALAGISLFAGNFRPAGVEIQGSKHEPVGAHLVPELIEEMCDYVNEHWEAATPIHLGAYIMWRLNWIHPFADGNGRTSRILSYVVLSIRAGALLPGTPTIPDQIVSTKPSGPASGRSPSPR